MMLGQAGRCRGICCRSRSATFSLAAACSAGTMASRDVLQPAHKRSVVAIDFEAASHNSYPKVHCERPMDAVTDSGTT